MSTDLFIVYMFHAISRLRCAFSESWGCNTVSRSCVSHTQSTNFEPFLAWQRVMIYVACGMEEASASLGSILQSGSMSQSNGGFSYRVIRREWLPNKQDRSERERAEDHLTTTEWSRSWSIQPQVQDVHEKRIAPSSTFWVKQQSRDCA